MERVIYSVKDVNAYIKASLSNDQNLKYIYVKGEISNCKIAATGHIYFSLKDEESLINGVMFANLASKLTFVPKNGDEVILLASIDVYVPRGSYQLFVYEMALEGQGNILIELEKLKKQLLSEGLFDESRKRKINIFPKAIGIITARNSAAIKDLLFNIKRRYPVVDIYIFYSSVQGENAPKELLAAFNKSQQYPLDTLIIGRGGGASEDLSAFNDEKLVRAVANSKMPVIAAVGHEIDSTLIDYVADKRASTPTGAAELATVDQREIQQKISYIFDDMKRILQEKIQNIEEDIIFYKDNLKRNLTDKLNNYSLRLLANKKQLSSLNPKAVLYRGYSILLDKNGKPITSSKQINKGDKVEGILYEGKLDLIVEENNNGK